MEPPEIACSSDLFSIQYQTCVPMHAHVFVDTLQDLTARTAVASEFLSILTSQKRVGLLNTSTVSIIKFNILRMVKIMKIHLYIKTL